MLLLFLIVVFSPVLALKGLTLETLWKFFNVHPFWFMLLLIDTFKINPLLIYRKDK